MARLLLTTFLLLQIDPYLNRGQCWVLRNVDAGLSNAQDPRYFSRMPGLNGFIIAAEVKQNDFNSAAKVLGLPDAKRCTL